MYKTFIFHNVTFYCRQLPSVYIRSDDESNKFRVKYGSESWTGYWSLCACVNRAMDEGMDLTDMRQDFDLGKLRKIFRSDSATEMPMIEERYKVRKHSNS